MPLWKKNNGQKVAQFARDNAANWNGSKSSIKHYNNLSASMCWDGVIYCLLKCKVRLKHIKEPIVADDYTRFVPDPKLNELSNIIETKEQMKACLPGSLLAFINMSDKNKLIHAMVSLGAGAAAGNKNECIGIGSPIGWEVINLADGSDKASLDWSIKEASFRQGSRAIRIIEFPL